MKVHHFWLKRSLAPPTLEDRRRDEMVSTLCGCIMKIFSYSLVYLGLEYNKYEAGVSLVHLYEILIDNFTDVLAFYFLHLCALSHAAAHHLRIEHRHEPLAFELSSVGLEVGFQQLRNITLHERNTCTDFFLAEVLLSDHVL
jgi:hypothetical protein